MIVAGGTTRTTTCLASSACTTTLSAADVAAAGNLSVQIRNPDGTASNQAALAVVLQTPVDDVIALSGAASSATGKNIVAVEPSTAGTSAAGSNVGLNVAALGFFSSAPTPARWGAARQCWCGPPWAPAWPTSAYFRAAGSMRGCGTAFPDRAM